MSPYVCVCGKKTCKFNTLKECSKAKKDVSVVLPTYNEEGNIERLILALSKALKGYNFEIVIVDDVSKDKTPKIMDKYAKKGIVVALHRTEIRGIFSAIRDGIRISRGKTVIIMDADFSHPPEKVAELMKHTKQYDLVSGSRFTKGGGIKAPFSRTFGTVLFNTVIRFILGLKITDWTGGFHAVNKNKLKQLRFKYPANWGEFDLELLYRAKKNHFSIKEIPFYYSFREEGKSKSAEGIGFLVGYAFKYGLRAIRLRIFG